MNALTPVIQSRGGSHLGFIPVYHWTDLAGAAHVHHGNIYRSEAEAMAAAYVAKPASWASWTAQVERCATRFESGPVIRSRKSIAELMFGELQQEKAA